MPFGNCVRFRIQHDASGFAATGGQHHDLAAHFYFFARLLVDIGNAGRHAVGADQDLAHHGACTDFQISGLHCGLDVYAGRIEVRVDAARPSALRAIVASRASIQRARQDGEPRRNAGNIELVACGLDQTLVAARRGARLKLTVRRIFEALVRAKDADQTFGLVVVRRKIVVRNGPVKAFAVTAVRLEVVRTHAERDAAVVIRAATQHTRAPPDPFGAGGIGVRLAGNLPAAYRSWRRSSPRIFRACRPRDAARCTATRTSWCLSCSRTIRLLRACRSLRPPKRERARRHRHPLQSQQ